MLIYYVIIMFIVPLLLAGYWAYIDAAEVAKIERSNNELREQLKREGIDCDL